MDRKKFVCIGLLSLTILATELFWTRLFSAEFFYTFAFLILSLAVLGLGIGALALKMFKKLNRPALLPVWLSLAGLMILVAVPATFSLNLDFSKLIAEPAQIPKLAAAVMLLASGYFFGGMAIAQIFKSNPTEIAKLYMSDFIGASLGVVTFFIVMNSFGATFTLVFGSFPALLGSFILAERWLKTLPASVFIAAVIYVLAAGGLPEQKREERAPVIHKHWDATAKIKVYEYDTASRGINIDNVANSPVYLFDGKWPQEDSLKIRFNIDVRNLVRKFDKCCFLSLGSGGGTDVLQALQYNAAEVHAVEVIPYINYLMKDGFLKGYSGNIYNDPRVIVVTEDARSYIRRYHNKFDIIYSLSSNTWAALASGSFALAENYIFTTEAFIDYWKALSDSGFLSIEHQFYVPRLVAELTEALHELKVADPYSHFAVYDLPALRRKLLLISKTPLDGQTISNAYGNSAPEIVQSMRNLYPPSDDKEGNIINSVVRSGWRAVADTARIDISPCTDDRPFIAQLGLMRNFTPSKLEKIPSYEFTGFPLSKIILLVILGVCLVIIIPLNLLPYAMKGEKLPFASWLYFFAVGMGYMMIEVVLIQKYTLFIGSSAYSIALVLAALLVFSGIGSRHSTRFAYKTIFTVIGLWLVADIFIFKNLFYAFAQWPLLLRMVFSCFLIAPAGYFMGMPFPKAASRFPAVIDWAFAVSGSASVVGSVIIVLIATSFGYSVALSAGLAMYLLAWLI